MKGQLYFLALFSLIGLLGARTTIVISILLWLIFNLFQHQIISKKLLISSGCVMLFFFMLFTNITHEKENVSFENGSYLTISGDVKTVTPVIDNKFKVRVKAENNSLWLVTVVLENSSLIHPKILPFSSCQFSGLTFDIEHATNRGQFNYYNYLKNQQISHTLLVSSPETILCNSSNNPLSFIYDLRFSILDFLRKNFSESTSAWMAALLFGEDGWINDEERELFQKWGLSHLLALSGLHVGYVILFFFSISLYILRISVQRTRFWIGLFLPIYGLMAGWAAPIQRAVGMAEIGLVGWKWRKKWPLLDVLCFFFLLLLVISPFSIYSLGFQFSYLVTFFLLLSRKLFENTGKMALLCRISLISQLSLLPLQTHYFYSINPLSVFANIWMIPLFTLILLPFLFFLLITSSLPVLKDFTFLDSIFEWLIEKVIYLLKGMDYLFQGEWVVGNIPISSIFLYYVFFIGFLRSWEKGRSWSTFLFTLAFTGTIIVASALPYLSSEGSVTVLDVGQGDTSIIELPYRKGIILVDVKGDMEGSYSYDNFIKPFLKSKGISTIDSVIVSHSDLDHSGGLPFLLKDFKVNQIVSSPFSSLIAEYKNVTVVKGKETLSWAGTDFYFWHPTTKEKDENDQSLVFSVVLGGKNWLFTGDISKEMESQLISTFPSLSADVLKVSHHGSKTSTSEEFLTQIQADVAIISVGRRNGYGHPSPEVIDRLNQRSMVVLRTDLHGMINYIFDKTSGTFLTFLP
ncbi:DNA internalization-related competence protein ComEC/Rec2 [Bacillaceae bacterium S4-13-58]